MFGLDMLQHFNAANKVRCSGFSLFRKCWVIRQIVKFEMKLLAKDLSQTHFSSTVICN